MLLLSRNVLTTTVPSIHPKILIMFFRNKSKKKEMLNLYAELFKCLCLNSAFVCVRSCGARITYKTGGGGSDTGS